MKKLFITSSDIFNLSKEKRLVHNEKFKPTIPSTPEQALDTLFNDKPDHNEHVLAKERAEQETQKAEESGADLISKSLAQNDGQKRSKGQQPTIEEVLSRPINRRKPKRMARKSKLRRKPKNTKQIRASLAKKGASEAALRVFDQVQKNPRLKDLKTFIKAQTRKGIPLLTTLEDLASIARDQNKKTEKSQKLPPMLPEEEPGDNPNNANEKQARDYLVSTLIDNKLYTASFMLDKFDKNPAIKSAMKTFIQNRFHMELRYDTPVHIWEIAAQNIVLNNKTLFTAFKKEYPIHAEALKTGKPIEEVAAARLPKRVRGRLEEKGLNDKQIKYAARYLAEYFSATYNNNGPFNPNDQRRLDEAVMMAKGKA